MKCTYCRIGYWLKSTVLHSKYYLQIADDTAIIHCKTGEMYTRLITATCEAGPGTTHMCTFEICVWSLQILWFADRCVFSNSIYGWSKCHLFIEILKHLKSSCHGSNHHPFNVLWSISVSTVCPVRIDPQLSVLLAVHLTTTLWH
jgi:hypothetical protein